MDPACGEGPTIAEPAQLSEEALRRWLSNRHLPSDVTACRAVKLGSPPADGLACQASASPSGGVTRWALWRASSDRLESVFETPPSELGIVELRLAFTESPSSFFVRDEPRGACNSVYSELKTKRRSREGDRSAERELVRLCNARGRYVWTGARFERERALPICPLIDDAL